MFRSNAISKNLELIAKDTAGNPEAQGTLNTLRAGVGYFGAKLYRAVTRVGNTIVDLPSDTQYELQPRSGRVDEIRAAIREIWHTRWFNGPLRPLNIVPKAIKTVISGVDAVGRDGLQLVGGGRKHDGYVIKPVGQG